MPHRWPANLRWRWGMQPRVILQCHPKNMKAILSCYGRRCYCGALLNVVGCPNTVLMLAGLKHQRGGGCGGATDRTGLRHCPKVNVIVPARNYSLDIPSAALFKAPTNPSVAARSATSAPVSSHAEQNSHHGLK